MIYILADNDTNKKYARVKVLSRGSKPTFITPSDLSEGLLENYASSNSLFGELSILATENIIGEGKIILSSQLLEKLQDSPTIFIFLEDKLLASSEKKYKKYASIERFVEKKQAIAPKANTFAIADMFGRHDKIGAWILYREAIEAGIEPEPISGILFWKIKTMMLSGSKFFTAEILKKQSADLVSLYHRAHRGESDFVIGLEQFILSALSK